MFYVQAPGTYITSFFSQLMNRSKKLECYTKPEMFAWDKYFSLLGPFIGYEEKKEFQGLFRS